MPQYKIYLIRKGDSECNESRDVEKTKIKQRTIPNLYWRFIMCEACCKCFPHRSPHWSLTKTRKQVLLFTPFHKWRHWLLEVAHLIRGRVGWLTPKFLLLNPMCHSSSSRDINWIFNRQETRTNKQKHLQITKQNKKKSLPVTVSNPNFCLQTTKTKTDGVIRHPPTSLLWFLDIWIDVKTGSMNNIRVCLVNSQSKPSSRNQRWECGS